MFEPTETESRQSLDLLADVCAAIVAEAEADLAFVQNAPHNTPVERVDEVAAARRPVLRWSESLRQARAAAGPPFGDTETPPTPTA
jgi:glycine dehydrogenase subunit 2